MKKLHVTVTFDMPDEATVGHVHNALLEISRTIPRNVWDLPLQDAVNTYGQAFTYAGEGGKRELTFASIETERW